MECKCVAYKSLTGRSGGRHDCDGKLGKSGFFEKRSDPTLRSSRPLPPESAVRISKFPPYHKFEATPSLLSLLLPLAGTKATWQITPALWQPRCHGNHHTLSFWSPAMSSIGGGDAGAQRELRWDSTVFRRQSSSLKQIKRIRIPSLSNSDLAGIQGICPDNANKSNSNMALRGMSKVMSVWLMEGAFIYSSRANHEPPLLSEIPPTSAPITPLVLSLINLMCVLALSCSQRNMFYLINRS